MLRLCLHACTGSQPGSPPAASAAAAAYPRATASHEVVVADRGLFMRTLRALHEALGTQFRIPTVSGKELDLHLLYKQVRPILAASMRLHSHLEVRTKRTS
jgi:hypothetical protein